MKKQRSQEEIFLEMTEAPVNKLIPRLAVPTIISMLITSVYNMADTFFVSQINTSASAAVGINYSLMTMIQAIGYTLGIGSGGYVSRALGKKLREKAEITATIGFFTAIVLGFILAVLGLANLNSLMKFLGATDTVLHYAKDYGKYILIAAPYMCAAFVLNNLLRSQGNAFKSMIGIAAGGVLNIVLDPILIFSFNMGIAGAAIATILSQLISFIILSYMLFSDKNACKPNIRKITLKLWPYKEILHGGFPSLCRQGLASASTATLNIAASIYGDGAIAAMSIVTRIMSFIYSSTLGFGQGFQPVCGYSYGAKKYQRVLDAFWFCVKVAVILLSILGIIFFITAPYIMALFRKGDLEVISIGTVALRLQCITLPLQAWIIMSNMLTQSIGFGIRASIIAMGRQGLFYIPALLLLPKVYGILGLQMSQAVADIFTFILAIIIIHFILKELKSKRELV